MTYDNSLPAFVRNPDPSVYLGDDWIVCDVETTNLEKGTALNRSNRLLLADWRRCLSGQGGREHRSVWGSEFEQHEWVEAVRASRFLVAHNAKFELQWLRRCGADLRGILVWDTMIAEKVLAGNRKVPLGLEATAARRALGAKDATASLLLKGGVCPSEFPREILSEYCAQDVALTEKIFLVQRRELETLGLLPVMYSRCLATPCLADIEFNGMYLDSPKVGETHADFAVRYRALSGEFDSFTGGINFRSPKQLGEYLYDELGFAELTDRRGNPVRSAVGGRKTDKATVPQLVASTDKQREFKKLLGSLIKLKIPFQTLEKFQKVIKETPEDPRVFANFNQTVTDTHRLSSTSRNKGPQFQNIDRSFRELFKASKEGYSIIECDAAQLEFRIAADLARDSAALNAIRTGEDVHALTAETLGIGRQEAKAFTFRPLYGGNSGTPKEKRYFQAFRDRYKDIYAMQTAWTFEVAKTKKLRMASGLIFYWPDCVIKDGGYITNTTQIFNFAIQSFSTADIIPLILLDVWMKTKDLDCTVLNTVHDSIVLEVADNAIEDVIAVLVDAFTKQIYTTIKQIYNYELVVQMGIGVKVGKHWGEGKERKYASV